VIKRHKTEKKIYIFLVYVFICKIIKISNKKKETNKQANKEKGTHKIVYR